MQARLWRIAPLAGAITLAALLTAACAASPQAQDVASISGSNQPSGSKAPGLTGDDEFTKCLRENGGAPQEVEVPVDGSGQGTLNGSPPAQADQEAQRKALEKCRQFLPDGGNPKPMSPENLEQARAFAKCMRTAGVPYPDPDPNDFGGEGVAKLPEGVDTKDPAVREKLNKCTQETSGGSPVAGGSTT